MKLDSESYIYIFATIIIIAIITCITVFTINHEKEKEMKAEELIYERVISENTISACNEYKKKYSNGIFFKEVEIIEENIRKDIEEKKIIEELKWSTDSKAWSEAQEINTAWSYKKYIDLYPHGHYVKKADRLLIDAEVDNIMKGHYGDMPSMEKASNTGGINSNISVTNNTSHTLTVRYSGNDSKKLIVSPNGTSNLTLKNGTYRIAASVDASNVRNFAGTESLLGGNYNVTYYIHTSIY